MLSDAECRRHNQLPPPTHAPLLPPSTTSQLDCRHYLRCSGCTLDNSLDSPPIYQEAAAFFQSLDVVLPPLRVGNVHGWRHRARLAVRAHSARDPRPAIGLFAEGTHSVMPISDCRVHHPSINAAVAAVAECAEAAGVSGYNERTGLGQLRYLQATVVGNEPSSSKGSGSGGRARVQLALVWNSSATEEEELAAKASAAAQAAVSRAQRQAWRRPPRQPHATPLRHLASELWLRHGGNGLLHSIWANFQPLRSNTILGPEWLLLHGQERAWAALGGTEVCFTPASFMQASAECA